MQTDLECHLQRRLQTEATESESVTPNGWEMSKCGYAFLNSTPRVQKPVIPNLHLAKTLTEVSKSHTKLL